MINQFSIFETKPNTLPSNNNVYIAFDPGTDGALVVLRGPEIIRKHIAPKKKVKSKTPTKDGKTKKNKKDANGRNIYLDKLVLDEQAYCDIIKSVKNEFPKAKVIIEKVKNIEGSGAMANFNFGHNFGLLRGFIISIFGDQFTETTPQNWQKTVIKYSDKVLLKESLKNDTKATSLNAFLRIFPNVDMRATPRSKTYHDGLVDAALIAKYAQMVDNLSDNYEEDTFVDEF